MDNWKYCAASIDGTEIVYSECIVKFIKLYFHIFLGEKKYKTY